MILPGAGPFYYEGNEIGILMFPGGGGGTCADLKPLGEDLHKEKGYTIHIPLLPGFGTTPEDLRNVRIPEWNAALTKEFNSLKTKCEIIIVGGHSLVGVFSLILATKYNLDGVFTISVPVGIRGIKGIGYKLAPLIRLFLKYYPIESEGWREETKEKWVGYDRIPLNVVSKYKKLMYEMRDTLSKVKDPIILFQGRLDSDIKEKSMDYIFEKVNSKIKKKIWLEKTTHFILDCPDHNIIVSELIKFINQITS